MDKENEIDESFVVNSKDGSEFHVSPLLNYSVRRERVPYIFAKYRVELATIESGFLKTAVYDAFRVVANSYTADALISNRQEFEKKVREVLVKQLEPEGFTLSQFTSNLIYPATFKRAIEAKNNAVQTALTAENQVKTAEAEAKIKIARAEGAAKALLTNARAEAESNRLRQQTLTPLLLQQMWIDSDIVFTPQQFQKLLDHKEDIVSGIYKMDGGTHYATTSVTGTNWLISQSAVAETYDENNKDGLVMDKPRIKDGQEYVWIDNRKVRAVTYLGTWTELKEVDAKIQIFE